MMNNVVLMFSPTGEKIRYEQRENRTVIRFSQQPRDRQFIKFLNVPRHGPYLKEYFWVYCDPYVQLRSVKDLILRENYKKKKKASLKTVNHHGEGIYNSFNLELSAFAEVVQWIGALTFSSILRVRVRIISGKPSESLFFIRFSNEPGL